MGDSGEQEHQAALARLTALVAGRDGNGVPDRQAPDRDVPGGRSAGATPGLPPWWRAGDDGADDEADAPDLTAEEHHAAAATDPADQGADSSTAQREDPRADGRAGLRIPLPDRWRGARARMSRRGMIIALVVAALAAAWAGVGALRDAPVTQAVPPVAGGPDGPVPQTLPTGGASSGPVDGPGPGSGPDGADEPAAEEIVVAVQGLVGTSGLVRLPAGARVDDAIAAAGGPLEGADLLTLNLAQPLADGDQVLVGIAPTDGEPPRLGSATVTAAGSGAAGGGDTGAGGDGGGEGGGALDLNTATAAQLETLPGIGPVTAESIVAWRTEQGPFSSVDDLTRVAGIGPARLANLRAHVTVR